jgi:hypothetical protein
MSHIVLLGDSVFDNRVYANPEPDVMTHLQTLEGGSNRVTLLAVDGSVTSDVLSQVPDVPSDATHLVVSSGGNDALSSQHLLMERAGTVADGLSLFAEPLDRFARSYLTLVRELRSKKLPLALCTIYNGNLPDDQAKAARAGVSLFNDIIQRIAISARAHIIELRSICRNPEDYANPIEPSGTGGLKIAQSIHRWAAGT